MKVKKDLLSLSPLRISIIYLVVACLWILFTDRILENFVTDASQMSLFQSYKGWFYMIITSIGLYFLIDKHDQNEKKLTEEKYLDQELLNKLFTKIPVMITVYNPDVNRIRLNNAFIAITGYTTEDIKNKNLMEQCYPNPEYRQEILEFMSNPESGWKDVIVNSKSGVDLYTSWTNLRLSDETQVGIGIDLTEISTTRKEKLKNEITHRSIFQSLNECVLLIEPKTWVIIDCNKATKDILGYSREELIGFSTEKFHVNKEHYKLFNEISLPVILDNDVFQTEFELKRKDGKIIVTDYTVTVTRDQDNEILQFVSVVRDITEQKKAEQEVKKSEELYRHLFHKSPQPLWIFELETLRFLEVNYAAIKQYGYTKKEFLSMKITDIRPESERAKLESEIQNLNKEDNSENKWVHLKKNGERIDVNTYGTAIEFEGKSARLVLINDVTQKNKNKEFLIQATLQGEDRERKRIAQELHDGIGQYLSAINLNMESLKKETSSFSEKKKNRFLTTLKFVKKAMNETRTMAYALMPAELEELGLYAALNTLAKEIEQSTEIKVIVDDSADESAFEITMISNLYRIAQEGIKNAIEHGKASEIKLTFEESNGQLNFIISDNGIGVDPDKINTSSGIGIRSINARTEAMSGEARITANIGAGYKIQITVPLNGNHK